MARLIDSIFGHEQIWSRLTSLAAANRLPHALAFTGPPGVGKRMLAWALAQWLVCARAVQGRPCGQCPQCQRVALRQSESVFAVEPQGHAIKIEAAHDIVRFLSLQQIGLARVVIIDQGQLLNPYAANALLKIVEEPPSATHFIFIVPEISQLLPTLRSRLQVVRFRPLPIEVLRQKDDIPDWMLLSARGSFENLEAFYDSESGELRQTVLGFLVSAFRGERAGLNQMLEVGKNKEAALKGLLLLQQLLRDWALLDSGEILHTDARAELSKMPKWDERAKSELMRYSLQMESDLMGNVDRSLIFENFFYRVCPQLG